MAGKKAAGENSKKVAGNAKKAEAAAGKKAQEDQKKAAVEDKEWSKGSKDNSKAEAAKQKAEEAARKKAEKAALAAEEEASLPSKKTGNAKTAQKKSRGLDLSALDDPAPSAALGSLNATGIDNALDALSLTTGSADKIDKHPERRFKAAYKAFEEKRLEEMEDEKGLRKNQKIERIRKEFEKHPDNPFNQVNASYNSTRDDIAALRESEKTKIETRLSGPNN